MARDFLVHLLTLEGLRVELDGKPVLYNLSAHARGGTVTAVLGPNGAGKTTLLRSVAGVLTPAKGAILADGEPVEPGGHLWQNRVAYCPDTGLAVDELTVRDNLELAALLFGHPRGESAARARSVAAVVGLETRMEDPAAELSHGQARRLSIGLMLVRDAAVYLFDEPFNGLDDEGVLMALQVLHALKHAGRIVLVAGHMGFHLAGTATVLWRIRPDGGVCVAVDEAASQELAARPSGLDVVDPIDLPWLIS